MTLKRKQILMIGKSLLVTGLILFVSSIVFIQFYIFNLKSNPEEFINFVNIYYVMLISGVAITIVGWCLVLYTKHPYYSERWAAENQQIEFKPIKSS
jgi:hypothetical protein